jgi:hypothetical protein
MWKTKHSLGESGLNMAFGALCVGLFVSSNGQSHVGELTSTHTFKKTTDGKIALYVLTYN